jgi:hypothetical protein
LSHHSTHSLETKQQILKTQVNANFTGGVSSLKSKHVRILPSNEKSVVCFSLHSLSLNFSGIFYENLVEISMKRLNCFGRRVADGENGVINLHLTVSHRQEFR